MTNLSNVSLINGGPTLTKKTTNHSGLEVEGISSWVEVTAYGPLAERIKYLKADSIVGFHLISSHVGIVDKSVNYHPKIMGIVACFRVLK